MNEYKRPYHEVANLFPLLDGDKYEEFKRDIADNGLLEAIWIDSEGAIIDGRNRHRACLDLGIEPRFRQWNGQGSLVSFVVSLNLHRRHLSKSQQAALAVDALPMYEAEARERQKGGQGGVLLKEIVPEANGQARDHAAADFNTNPRYVQDAKKIKEEDPDLFEQVRAGELTIPQAKREISRTNTIKKLNSIEEKTAKEIKGVYDVIVIDPPWPMKKINRDVAPNQVEFDYPTMTIDELQNLNIPYANNCHVWLWTTHKYLPHALELLKGWGLSYVCTFTWHKNGGFQPFGLPQYNCEFALYARKGTPEFFDLKQFYTCFDAPRGAHSEKPKVFYDTINRVTEGRRLDMFSRRLIDGFDTWGLEAIDE